MGTKASTCSRSAIWDKINCSSEAKTDKIVTVRQAWALLLFFFFFFFQLYFFEK